MKTFWFGLSITLVYFIILGVSVVGLKLDVMTSWNELGDFLAGAFSPIAFLWLVIGYLQQQKELQQNTRALELQAEELKNSVDQYREMVTVARDQLLMDRENINQSRMDKENQYKPRIKPPLILPYVTSGGVNYKYRGVLELAGEDAENLSIQTEPHFSPYHGFSAHSMKSGLVQLGESQMLNSGELPKEIVLTIKYESRLGVSYVDKYTYLLADSGCYSIVDDEHI
ncbi:hypothetical protein P9A04_00660 [Serratia marcescens]|uniref:hypothetical protein n=1 Tax=Serratia TaxID=613 RepID=UPI00217A9B37|nr:hypothetical protein [Serratia marcescens]CAI1560009.1 Uncharacterised protein [Serratia marcescens]HAV6635623.1 hypothetical protein [Serratia marcescens]